MRTPRPPLEDRPWPWLAPLLILLAALYLYPLMDVVRLSFTDAGGVGSAYSYTLRSYETVLGSQDFVETARTTAIFVIASVVGQLLCGLLIAALVTEGERRALPGAALVRSIVMVGWVLPGVVLGIIWKLLLEESGSGILASAVAGLGFRDPTFLSAPTPALIWVTIANIWRGTAFSMLTQYAGMKTVPPELYEAAKIDGANAWQRFLYITVAALRNILLINLILITIATLNTFDMIMPLTGGGPGRATEVIALYIYRTIFVTFSQGRGAAAATVLMCVGLVLSLVYVRLLPRDRQ